MTPEIGLGFPSASGDADVARDRYRLGFLGCGRGKLQEMQRIKGGTRLFLVNFQTRQLYGVFQRLRPAAQPTSQGQGALRSRRQGKGRQGRC